MSRLSPVTGSRVACLALAAALGLYATQALAREYHSYAFVNDDASLRVSNRHIRLFGIHVPRGSRQCDGALRSNRCETRAARALEFKIQGFVRCREIQRFRDRSISAQCFNRDVDLAAYLIEQGWAVAVPGAPINYVTLERIAEKRGMGIWGVDTGSRRRDRRLH